MVTYSSEAVWTVLPNGFSDAKQLKASILVSPRLWSDAGDPVLGGHDGWKVWRNWAAAMGEAGVFLTAPGLSAPVKATVVSKTDKAVFEALFGDATPVKPFVFSDWSKKKVLSYPLADLAVALDETYGGWALAAGEELPKRGEFGDRFSRDFQPKRRTRPEDVLRMVAEGQAFGRTLGQNGQGASTAQLAQALDLLSTYHRPLNKQELAVWTPEAGDEVHEPARYRKGSRTALPSKAELARKVDFHQIAAALIQYPDLARACGFVVDVEIAPAAVAAAGANLKLSVAEVVFDGFDPPAPISPVSMIRNTDTGFFLQGAPLPAGQVSPFVERWLRLDASGPYRLVQMDVDGAGLKFSQFAESMLREVPADFDDDILPADPQAEPQAGAPSIRTGGLTLAHRRRDLSLQAAFVQAKSLNVAALAHAAAPTDPTKPAATVFAGDAVRGYRIDVLDETKGQWRSLCARHGAYTFTKGGHAPLPFGSPDAPAPGKPLDEGMVRAAAGSSSDGSNPNLVKVHEGLFSWRGWSLCAPEPGKWVKSDNSFSGAADPLPSGLPLDVAFAAQPGTLPSLRFGRSYRVRVRLVDLAGNSLAADAAAPAGAVSDPQTYLRYEPVEPPSLALLGDRPGTVELPGDGESMGRLAIRTLDAGLAEPKRARRHIVPPRVGARFAEQHGVLDGPDGRIDAGKWSTLINQDSPLIDLEVDGQRWPCARERFVLPFLPDPMAVAVAVRVLGVDGINPKVVHHVPLYGDTVPVTAAAAKDWPKARPFEIELVDGGPGAGFTIEGTGRRVFRLRLTKAQRARLRVSCVLPASAKSMMKWRARVASAGLPAAQQHALDDLVEGGGHWMLTPWRTVELVHAVQRPLAKPGILNIDTAQRAFGELDAQLFFETPLDAKSTGRLDLYGEWNEVEDAAGTPRPEGRRATADAWGRTITRKETQASFHAEARRAPPEHKFADTRYRRVSYRLDATTRHREFMPAGLRDKPDELKVSSDLKQVWIPNAAPPAPPSVLYVVPTFGWSRTQSGGEKRSMRFGGGLRVYLDRPWFSSGYGEMLGVVLATEGTPSAELNGRLKSLVTQWGRDPVWPQAPLTQFAPARSAFPLARYQAPIAFDGLPDLPAEEGSALPPGPFRQGLSHRALAGSSLKLDVAPHAVGWDDERKLWYADIVVNLPSTAYLPFIRLALGRYHPVSVDGAHLSDVVLAEFQQLTPDRLAVVTEALGAPKTVPPTQAFKVQVYGVLPKPKEHSAWQEAGKIDVRVQVLPPDGCPDLDWVDWHIPEGSKSLAPGVGGLPVSVGTGGSGVKLDGGAVLGALVSGVANQSARAQADKLAAQGRFDDIVRDPMLIASVIPPLIEEVSVVAPLPQPGVRRRLLITESEVYRTTPGTGAPKSSEIAERIVFVETVEI
ncbi:hypothetical protein [Caulobacter sp. 17J65-9]|uniref:hypothetical protein n=1 Tax=Caulobacter sp. 17J65-9 TaxID=2709382 RepID=UPI0013CCB35D|nr:hypothetical protein [Caulobacter sp. 17J65-9]NEX91527.1 hypothetical protein [Caulobacter sp. 17J65-9]